MSEASVASKVLIVFLNNEKQTQTEPPDLVVPPPVHSHDDSDSDSSKNSEDDGQFECDSEEDPAWHDSDYDLAKDDELYAQNVDELYAQNGN